ncbi:AMP-dependent synthetase/ligase [Amycolatopsis suaedae]|uniref:Acyl-CoA synthetase n=1 Tax=Amycolatopsis suaedae TaxID=2510978 RepID=A0A4Q7JAB6_9PSEU|nr:AMP-dependent synthetase/ligase [Amycolatopsis suaedae]RZQ63906.1 long-chain fatty acid--CoA ligase [Amycolatopsis suaedae]
MHTLTDPARARAARSMCQLFQDSVTAVPERVALRSSDGAVSITWREYGDRVRHIASGLAAVGVGHGDTVGIMLTNRPEFHLVDTAAFHLGATPFSIYNTSAPGQIEYLLGNAGCRVFITEQQFLDKVREASAGSAVERVVVVEDDVDGTMSLTDLETRGNPDFDFDAAWRAVQPDDILTLIYTSGTTGPPKGVEMTHGGMVFAVANSAEQFAGRPVERLVSYLPDAHAANRGYAHYASMLSGATITTVTDAKQLVAVLPRVRPSLFLGVPTLWYKLKAAIESAIDAQAGPRKKLATWAIDQGKRRVRTGSAGWRHALADRLVLSELRKRIGMDDLVLAFTAAAPITEDALEFVLALGIPCSEMWGMTEITIATANPIDDLRVGTVGKALPGVELKLADDGEILVRTPGVMRGYRGEPDKTAETIDPDGWVHTGDIATIDDDGWVRIVDRKKELIINAAGKNMSPSNIEGAVKAASPLIGNVAAIGDRRPYVVALITLEPDAAAAFAGKHGLAADPAVLARDSRVNEEIKHAVLTANAKLSRAEQIKDFTVLPTYWEPGSEVLTPTMKLRRKPITEAYAAEIDALYRGR